MIHHLLPQNGKFYKANLHCHTNFSDGKLSPEEIRRIYIEHGYSIVAYTDHDIFIPHPELCTETFLALNGFEVEICEKGDVPGLCRNCHLCFIALDASNVLHPLWHRSNYLFGNAPKHRNEVRFDKNVPDFVRTYSPECINAMIKAGREKGFFVTYNHPVWSLENYRDYSLLSGMNAMEICNYGCLVAGFEEYNPSVYDDLLKLNNRIYCISADDNHNFNSPDSSKWDSFGGFTMIKAEGLEYSAITQAMLHGSFYASQGPEIYELWYDDTDSTVHIATSPAARINCVSAARYGRVAYPDSDGVLNSACFKIYDNDIYIRITVTDGRGMHANTNAYFIDELKAL